MRKNLSDLARLLLLAVWCSATAATSLEMYIQDLSGGNEQACAIARQMLPREGSKAVPMLLPLLKVERQEVWRAAFNVLEDIANNVTAPGRDQERLAVTESLMKLVAPEEPYTIKERGLRLLPKVVPAGYDVHPISDLLKDPDLREKARAALAEMGTPESASALCDEIPSADPKFACALLDGLGAIRNSESLTCIEKMLDHPDAGVRSAALRALAWTGNPAYIKAGRKVFTQTDKATHWEAGDAYLRLADAIIREGGNHDAAIRVYQEVLRDSSDQNLKCAAIAGMSRFGDETVVPIILAAVTGPNGADLEGSAWVAFSSLQGRGSNKALIEAFQTLSPEMRITALSAFGRKRDPVFLSILGQNLKSDDAATHDVCAAALADTQLPAAVALLVADAGARTEDRKKASLASLKQLADTMRYQENRQAAGEAYHGLYQLTDSEDLRNVAFQGIRDFPVAASIEMLLDKTGTSDLMDSRQLSATLGIVKSLADSGHRDEASKALERIIGNLKSTEAVREAVPLLSSTLPARESAQRLGFVTDWLVAGGFPWSMSDGFQEKNVQEPEVDTSAAYKVGDREVGWKHFSSKDPGGLIDFSSAVGQLDHVCAYGWTAISVEAEADGILRVGSDDGIKVWINKESVHENNVDRGAQIDQDQAPIKLKAGRNCILIEVTQGGGGWNAYVRLTRLDGSPLPFSLVK